MNEPTNTDAKTEAAPSTPPAEPQQTAQGDKPPGEVSPASPTPVETLDSVIEQEAGKATEDKPPGKVSEPAPTEKATETKTPEEKKAPEGEKEPELPPFHEHPRWKQVVGERDDAVRQLAEVKPRLERLNALEAYRQQNRIDDQQLKQALELTALVNSDPKKAVEQLRTVLTNLEYSAGLRLSPDLQEEVDRGLVTQERAEEIMNLRAEKEREKITARQSDEVRYNAAQLEMIKGVNEWEDKTRTLFPDFKPKADKNAPDGLYERTVKSFTLATIQTPPRSGVEAAALAEKIFQDELTYARRNTPVKPNTPKVLSSTSASTKQVEKEPASLDELLEQEAQRLEASTKER